MGEPTPIAAAQFMKSETGRAKKALGAMIAEVARRERRASDVRRVLRLEVGTPRLDPLLWLNVQKDPVRIYWADRQGRFETAGIGETDRLEGDGFPDYRALFDRLHETLCGADDNVRYYGGMRFSDRRDPDAAWRSFGSCRFVLPRFELSSRNGESLLACNLVRDRDGGPPVAELLDSLDRVQFPSDGEGLEIPVVTGRRDTPNEAGWRNNIESAVRSFRRGTVQKIVLARRSSFDFDRDLNPVALLVKMKSAMPGCFHFCFSPASGTAFVGASPERLYLRQGRRIWSEAVAGTRPRGTSAGLDQGLGQDLLHNDKELREHRFVVQGIQEVLAPLCESLEAGGRVSLLRLTRCQHLLSAFEGVLGGAVRDADVLGRLHPTAAVGGYPTACALDEIERLESFDRGWYAGPIGWVAPRATEFAVAIRSGLIEGPRLFLFSGAGIVEGSTAEAEWSEIENKIGDFIHALAHP